MLICQDKIAAIGKEVKMGLGRGNPKAFEKVRQATQFQAAGSESLVAKVDLKVTPTMKAKLKAIPNWQDKLRQAIAALLEQSHSDEVGN